MLLITTKLFALKNNNSHRKKKHNLNDQSMQIKPIFFVILAILALSSCKKQPVISVESLLNEMVNRETLARFPDPEYTLRQFSSYDRATEKPGEPAWFANWDRSMFLRTDSLNGRKEYVMYDTDGPGAVVRFWMTFAGENCGRGILRIYFDHQEKPLIEGPALDILSGTLLVGAPLASSVSDSTKYEMRGHNLYFPLPYAQQCKITYESKNIADAGAKTGGEAVYYNIGYRTYKKGTKVITYSTEAMTTAAATIESVQEKLRNRDRGISGLNTDSLIVSRTIEAGGSLTQNIEGTKAIRQISFKVNPGINPKALRSTILEMVFDGEQTVWCPLGDFFNTGYQLRKSNTWYSSVSPDGDLNCWWVMPFQKSCEVRIHNLGLEEIEIQTLKIISSPWKWDKNSMHFGASWHQYTNLETGEMKDNEGNGGPFDINYVELTGKGVYVGDAITLFNTVYAWWGEGDEKIFVDHETFPSSIGTGTEDYYGYAWCRPEKFANHPYIGQPDGSGNFDPGYTVNLRHRGLDAIPFNQHLKFDFEMWHWTRATINFAPVSFWYVLPGGKSNISPDLDGAKAKVALKRSDIISHEIRNGKIEAESMVLESVTGGRFRYQNDVEKGWSDNMQAFWTGAQPTDKLVLSFDSPEDMTAEVTGHFTKASDYGSFKVKINGKSAGKLIELTHDSLMLQDISLGKVQLNKGQNKLEVEVVRTSSDPKKAFFGLDYLTCIKI